MTAKIRVAVLALLALAACSGGPEASDRPTIVVSTNVLGDLVGTIAGDDITVETLMSTGVDPHEFALSSEQAAQMADADLVVVNGLGLEEGMLDVVESLEADGLPVLELGPELDPLPFSGATADEHEEEDEEEGEHDEHSHDGDDPHVWLDPVRMARGVEVIGDRIVELGIAADVNGLEARAEDLAADILTAHEDADEMLAAIPADRRQLVTNHDSLGYFAERYGFEIVATVIPGGSTLAEPSSEEMSSLIDTISELGIPAIFADTTESSRLADIIAEEVGDDVQVVELATGSLGEPGTDTDTYVGMITANAAAIADALG